MSETLSTAAMNADLKRWGMPLRTELQDVFTGPLMGLADRIDTFIDEDPELLNKIAHIRPVDEVPYAVHNLPPNLYEHCGNPAPFVPNSEHELDRFMDSFWQDHLRLHARVPGFHAHATQAKYRTDLTSNLRQRRERGLTIDSTAWNDYQKSYHDQLDRGFYTLGHNAAIMNIPDILQFSDTRGIQNAAQGRQETYSLASLDSHHAIGLYLRVPKGEYGAVPAKRLLRTASVLCDFVQQDRTFAEELWKNVDQHYDVVAKHTTRGKSNRAATQGVVYGNEESTIVAAQEGMISILAGFNLLTAEKVSGYDDLGVLASEIADEDLINKLTLIISQGVAGSAAVNGIYFPKTLRSETGNLTFNTNVQQSLKGLREGVTAIMHESWRKYHANIAAIGKVAATAESPQPLLGLPCLAAGPYKQASRPVVPGAISRLTKTFVKVFNAISDEGPDQPTHVFPWDVPRVLEGRDS